MLFPISYYVIKTIIFFYIKFYFICFFYTNCIKYVYVKFNILTLLSNVYFYVKFSPYLSDTNIDYYIIFFFFILASLLSFILFFLTRLLNTGDILFDNEKLTTYECGFDPIEDSRLLINLPFYRVAILFIIFDLEIIFLLPWSVNLHNLSYFSIMHSYYFLFVLWVALMLEIKSKLLNW